LPFFDLPSSEHYAVLAPRGVDLISDGLPFSRLWFGGAEAVATQSASAKSFFFLLLRFELHLSASNIF